ncbi:HAMP domain-containing protein [Leptothoe spongobia]|uniref:GAF domain-containing protein n=1 Tax=Leptothoe spongobia TAU-MAC 1115 TaxID=1967444 RepID=A0A947GIF0_9CYAN|nr:HAMP domain-containing protein [Leptothoe spongobia]MBT9315193.1 GAF domain-containing protein [Leptothoe spongobia TAU-MAC 1115]
MVQQNAMTGQSKPNPALGVVGNWLGQWLTPQGNTLRSQLLLTILPVVLVPLLIASGIGYRVVQQRTEERLQRQLTDQSLLASGSTLAVLDELLTLPRVIANSPLVINEALAGSNEAANAGLDKLSVSELESKFTNTKLLRDHKSLNKYLQETVETAEISEISVTNRYGFNVAYSRPTTDFVQSDEDWWQRAKQDGVWISPPDFDFASKARTVELVQSIINPGDQQFVGVIRAVLPARKFSLLADYLQRTGISGSQRVQIIDSQTLGIIDTFSPQGFRKETKTIGAETVEAVITALSEIDFPADASATNIEAYEAQITKALSNQKQVRELSLILSENNIVLLSFIHKNRLYKVATIPTTKWVAIASMERREIASAGQELLLLFAVTAILLSGLTSGLIILLARQLSLPLANLADYSNQVASGDLTVAATPEGTRETRLLARTFNQLVSRTRTLLTAQEADTHKAKLFARIASAPADNLRAMRTIAEDALPDIQEILQADRVFFYRLSSNGSGLVESEVTTSNYRRATSYPNQKAFIPPNLLTEDIEVTTTVIDDVAKEIGEDSDAYYQCMELLDVKSSLIVPMAVDNALYGFWMVHHCEALHPWQPVEVAFVEQLSVQFQLVVERLNSLSEAQDARQVSETLSKKLQQQKERLQQQIAELTHTFKTETSSSQSTPKALEVNASEDLSDVFQNTFTHLLQLTANVEHINSQLKTSLAQTEETAVKVVEPMTYQTQAALTMLATLQPLIQTIPELVDVAQKALHRCRSFSGISNNIKQLQALDQPHAQNIEQETDKSANSTSVYLGLIDKEIGNISNTLNKIQVQINNGTEYVKDAQHHIEEVLKGEQQIDQLLQGLSFININQLQMTQAVDNLAKSMTLSSERTSNLTEEIDSVLDAEHRL